MADDIIPLAISVVTSFPVNIIIPLAIAGIIIYYLVKNRKPKEERFSIEDFRESVFIYCRDIMDYFGIKSDSCLVKGIEPQGKISKWYRYQGQFPKFVVNKKNNKLEPTSDKESLDFMIFQIGSQRFFLFDLLFGSTLKFVIIDTKLLNYNGKNNQWGIDEKVSLVPYANCFVASDSGINFINNISFMRSQEELLTYSQNYARKTAWLELAHAKTMDRIQGKIDAKTAGFDRYRAEALRGAEDDDDDD